MASTVITSAKSIVRVSHDLTVADDGLVTLKASFYVPPRLLAQARIDFQLYQRFRNYAEDSFLGSIFPTLQSEFTVASSAARQQNGLTFYDVTYVSALAPVKIAISESVQRYTFNGYVEDAVQGSGSFSFDYYSKAVTHKAAVVRPRKFTLTPKGKLITGGLNAIRSGYWQGVKFDPVETTSANQEIIGNVARMEVTSTVLYADTTAMAVVFLGTNLPNGGLSNPWEAEN